MAQMVSGAESGSRRFGSSTVIELLTRHALLAPSRTSLN